MFDASYPTGLHYYWKSNYVNELSDEAFEIIVAHAAQMTSPLSNFYFEHLGGAIGRALEDETAFGHRDALFDWTISSVWAGPGDSDGHIAWARGFWEAMRPFTSDAVYANNLGAEGEDRVRAAYSPAKYERLVALKNEYDPNNLLRLNQNIKPTRGRAAGIPPA
jgi:FAD/FMN-containing dehydrogenase